MEFECACVGFSLSALVFSESKRMHVRKCGKIYVNMLACVDFRFFNEMVCSLNLVQGVPPFLVATHVSCRCLSF